MNFTLAENDDGTLTLQRPGQDDLKDVRLRRSFPWSKATEFISIRDEKGKEQVLINNLADLPPEQQEIVRRWLASNSFIPTISRVNAINNDFGYQEWDVETDRGPTQFRVQEREDVRFLPDARFSIKDVDGNVYAMPPIHTLDRHSQRVAALIV